MDINTIISTFRQENLSESTLSNVTKFYNAETIADTDLVYLNMDSRDEAIIFIFTSKYYIKLAIGSFGLRYRSQHIIQRDIKKISADENSVSIYFHGLHIEQTIKVDNYAAAIKLQQHLTELRDTRYFNKGNKPSQK